MRLLSPLSRRMFSAFALGLVFLSPAGATPLLVVDAKTGDVLVEREATRPWFPASVTKLVTVYVALKAVRDGRISLDTPLRVSSRAARMPPSKMGFKPGQEVTLDNALKMLMVKSANDLAITVAEGVSGSVESFAGEMNNVAAKLGMRDSHFVNPNGLHDPNHYTSARDMAIIAMALYRDFPEHSDLYGIGALRLGSQIIPTHNGLLGRYPGAEGMKTGFTCPAGLNVVASATRGGRRLIAVVLGYSTAKARTLEAARILDMGFASGATGRGLASLASVGGEPPNMRQQVCGPHRQDVAEDDFAVQVAGQPAPPPSNDDGPAAFFRGLGAPAAPTPIDAGGVAATEAALAERPAFEPLDVYVGRAPGWTGPAAGPAVDVAADVDKPAARHATKGRKVATAEVKSKTAKADKTPKAKKTAAKPKPAKAATKSRAVSEPPKTVAHAATGKAKKTSDE